MRNLLWSMGRLKKSVTWVEVSEHCLRKRESEVSFCFKLTEDKFIKIRKYNTSFMKSRI